MKAKLPKQQKLRVYGYQVTGAVAKGHPTDPTTTTYMTTTHLAKR